MLYEDISYVPNNIQITNLDKKLYQYLIEISDKNYSDYETYNNFQDIVNDILSKCVIKDLHQLTKLSILLNIPLYEIAVKDINYNKPFTVDMQRKQLINNGINLSIYSRDFIELGNNNSVKATQLFKDFAKFNYYFMEYFYINDTVVTNKVRDEIEIKTLEGYYIEDILEDNIPNEIKNIKDYYKYLYYITLFDVAVANTDRHSGNIIYLYYKEDKTLHIAPIHDFDMSFEYPYDIPDTCIDCTKNAMTLYKDFPSLYEYMVNLNINELKDYVKIFIKK